MKTTTYPTRYGPRADRSGFIVRFAAHSAATLAFLALSALAHAQTPRPTGSGSATATDSLEETVEMNQFVVRGFRASLVQSLDAKRNANAIVDVITAEDVGKFPDTNVAESLSHLPGITVDRLFGQGEKVSILGTDPALNRTLLQGQTVASADWFILDTPGRTFNYTLLAPEIVGKVEVHRTPQGWLDEGSIGGTVVVHLRNPLDQKPHAIAGSIGYLYNERHEDGDPNYSLMYSWRNEAKSFGLALSAQHSDEHIRRDGVESYGTVAATEYDGYDHPTLRANPTARGPNAIGTAFFNQDRERRSYTGTAVYHPTEQLEFRFDALYVKSKYNNINQSLYTFPARPWDTTQDVDQATVSGGIITKLHLTQPVGVYDVQYREAEVETESYTFNAKYKGDSYNVTGVIGTTKASGGTQRQLFGEFLNRSNYGYDISGAPGNPVVVTWDDPNVPRNAALWVTDPGWGGNLVSKPTKDQEDYAQIDVEHEIGNSAIKKLRWGLKARQHETDQDMFGWTLTGVAWPASMFNGGLTPGNFLDGIDGVSDQMRNRITIDGQAMASAIAARNLTSTAPARFFDNIWSVEEDINAAYVQADFGAERLTGNIGVRYVDTETSSSGYVANTAGVFTPLSVDKKYENVLGSLNVAYELSQDWILRFGAAQVIARPNYADMTPYVALNDTVHTGDGGNPDLSPYKSHNYDLSAEWYINKDSIVAATLFYKDIGSYILRSTAPEQHYDVTTRTPNVTYQISRPRNAGSATSKGIALNYQQSLWYGFGVQTNYTYADASADNGGLLPFNSEHQFYLAPYWENKLLTVRVGYSWRDKYFTGIDRGDMIKVSDYTDLSLAAAIRATPNFTINLDAMNLTDEQYFAYANTPRMPRGIYKNGSRYLATVRFNF